MCGFPGGTEETHKQNTMKVVQHNLNHCKPAYDLRAQVVRIWKDLAIIPDPYKQLDIKLWVADALEMTNTWFNGHLRFNDNIDSSRNGFLRAKLGEILFYSHRAYISWILQSISTMTSGITNSRLSGLTSVHGQLIGVVRRLMREEMSYCKLNLVSILFSLTLLSTNITERRKEFHCAPHSY